MSGLSLSDPPELQLEIKRLRENQRRERRNVTLFRAPLRSMFIFTVVSYGYLLKCVHYLRVHNKMSSLVFAFVALTTIVFYISGPEQEYISDIEETFYEAVWWIVLGILSSVGLGTGLHTFVLYLGPLIAKVTIAATECNTTDFKLYGPERFICPVDAPEAHEITFWEILSKVQFQALMWGAGTAIGELPPYFVARAARLSGESLKELQDEDEEEDPSRTPSFFDRAMAVTKSYMYAALGNLGFFGILLFASVPNPLFDLAGITCGHFLIPFVTFFGATLIGKAFVKAHLQAIFVIVVFSKKRIEQVIDLIESFVPPLQGTLHGVIEAEKAKLHRVGGEVATKEKSIPAMLWDFVLIAMLLYFLVSIVDSSVQHHLCTKDEDAVRRLHQQRKQKAKRKSQNNRNDDNDNHNATNNANKDNNKPQRQSKKND